MWSINTILLGAVAFVAHRAVAEHGCSKTSDGWGLVNTNEVAGVINKLRETPDNVFYVPNGHTYSQDFWNVQVGGGET